MVENTELKLKIPEPTRKVVHNFVDLVSRNQSGNLVRVVLFGSVARGDYNKDSDIDIFVLLKNDDYKISESIVGDAQKSDMEFGDFGTYISPMTYTYNDYCKWEESGRAYPLILSRIKHEGIVLYDSEP